MIPVGIVNLGLVLPVILLAIALCSLGFLYAKLYVRYSNLQEKEKFFEEKAREESEEYLRNASRKAEQIIEEAREKAKELIQKSETIGDSVKDKLIAELDNVSQAQADGLRSVFSSVSKNFEQEAIAEIQKMRGSLESETKARVAEVQKEIEDYKAEELKKAEAEVREMVKKVSLQVLGKVISADEHTDLVIKALERAKKENVF